MRPPADRAREKLSTAGFRRELRQRTRDDRKRLCRLGSMENAAADLGKFRNERTGIPASEGRGVYLRGQQDGGCQVCAARETTLVDPSRELEKLGNTATHATVTNRILINAF